MVNLATLYNDIKTLVAQNFALKNHSHSDYLSNSDVANNLTTTESGKVLDARQGKVLGDLIGDAIQYINQ